MTTTTTPRWEAKRTAETRGVEEFLRRHFDTVDAYRFNPAVIRIRIIDSRFNNMSREQRDSLVEPCLEQLAPDTQRDILTLITFAPADLERPPATFKEFMMNAEFEDPSPSML